MEGLNCFVVKLSSHKPLLHGLHIWSKSEQRTQDHEVFLAEKRCLTVVTRRRLDLKWMDHSFHRFYCAKELADGEVDDVCGGRYWVPLARIDEGRYSRRRHYLACSAQIADCLIESARHMTIFGVGSLMQPS